VGACNCKHIIPAWFWQPPRGVRTRARARSPDGRAASKGRRVPMRAGAAAVQSRRAGVGQRVVIETDMARQRLFCIWPHSRSVCCQRITQQNALSSRRQHRDYSVAENPACPLVQVSRISIPAMFRRSVGSIKDTVPTRHSQHEGGKKPKTLLSNQTKQKTALTIAIR
jgi:hypothetical protein